MLDDKYHQRVEPSRQRNAIIPVKRSTVDSLYVCDDFAEGGAQCSI
jgi:hypothetical protein